MNEFRFLVGMIVILELVLFACGLKVVENRHNARKLFIELEHEQQIHHSLMDERARLKLEISNLEQIRQVEARAKEGNRKSTRLNSSHSRKSRMPSSA